jgi:hypothetical protein
MLKLKNNTFDRNTTFIFQLNVCTVVELLGLSLICKRTLPKSIVAVAAAATSYNAVTGAVVRAANSGCG